MKEKAGLTQCGKCNIPREKRACLVEGGKGPKFCPTLRYDSLIPTVEEIYRSQDIREIARLASIQEAECYQGRGSKDYVIHPSKPRLQEIMEFAEKIGAKRLGVAFCIGLQKEASILHELLESHGFEVVSVCCKVGRIPKETIGIEDYQKIMVGSFESMCNPIMQAEIMNMEGTQLNILLGLCVGHDSLFIKRSNALCTVFAVKDRVTGHNPLAALYTLHSYYQRLARR